LNLTSLAFGGLSYDREHWVYVPDKNKFFIAGKVLAKKFRGKFLDMLRQSKENGELDFQGKHSGIKGPVQFKRYLWILTSLSAVFCYMYSPKVF
jgi:phosphatidylserine/phosphatidylglycerophosphate/cardiolipin synthase-like enzyme